MNYSDLDKEHKSWRRWERLSFLTWLANFHWLRWMFPKFPFRGRYFSRKPPPTGMEAPLVSLMRLAEDGITEEPANRIKNREDLERVLSLFSSVATMDGSISGAEQFVMEKFIRENLPEDANNEHVEQYENFFKSCSEREFSLKETCFLLRQSLDRNVLIKVVETLFHLAYLHGLEPEERRIIDRIGTMLRLKPAEIRLAESSVKRGARGGTKDSEEVL